MHIYTNPMNINEYYSLLGYKSMINLHGFIYLNKFYQLLYHLYYRLSDHIKIT